MIESAYARRRCLALVAIATAAVLVHANTIRAGEHTEDSLELVQENITEKKAVLLDVRELAEWKRGHLAVAMLLPLSEIRERWDDPEFASKLEEKISKEKIIYTHCRSGGRCVIAAGPLRKMGYEVRPLKPGFQQLVQFGFEQAETDDEE